MVGPNRASNALPVSDMAETSEKGWDSQLSWYERIMLWVLRQGTIPKHFAIVADGNRTFSRKKKISLSQVYYLMFRKFTTTWPYMAALGVPEVTYFMISTRNFSRNTRDLVTAIDEMMKFFARTLQCLNIFRKIRLEVTAVGNFDLLPIEMREKIAQTEIGSDDESPAAKLRLCVAYNTKVGLKNMVLDLVKAVQAGAIESDDITAGFLADWLAVSEAPETELWFRSSGEMRFSEFLVLQSSYSYIHIDPQLWPTITFRNCIWAVLQFQLKWPYIKAIKDSHRDLWVYHQDRNGCASIIRQKSFLRRLKCAKMAYLSSQCFSELDQPTNASLRFSGDHLTE